LDIALSSRVQGRLVWNSTFSKDHRSIWDSFVLDLSENMPTGCIDSLHAPNQQLRAQIVPSAKAYPLESLLTDCKNYFQETGRRVSIEYTLLSKQQLHLAFEFFTVLQAYKESVEKFHALMIWTVNNGCNIISIFLYSKVRTN
jgi:hypothetical protein